MFTSWVLLVIAVVSLVILLTILIRHWNEVPSFLRWFAGLNILVVAVNIMCLGLTIEQQNNYYAADDLFSEQDEIQNQENRFSGPVDYLQYIDIQSEEINK